MSNEKKLQIINSVEPNGELMDTEQVIQCMDIYTSDIQKRIKELEDEKNLLTDSMKLIISKRTSIGWDSECSALVAEETLKKVK